MPETSKNIEETNPTKQKEEVREPPIVEAVSMTEEAQTLPVAHSEPKAASTAIQVEVEEKEDGNTLKVALPTPAAPNFKETSNEHELKENSKSLPAPDSNTNSKTPKSRSSSVSTEIESQKSTSTNPKVSQSRVSRARVATRGQKSNAKQPRSLSSTKRAKTTNGSSPNQQKQSSTLKRCPAKKRQRGHTAMTKRAWKLAKRNDPYLADFVVDSSDEDEDVTSSSESSYSTESSSDEDDSSRSGGRYIDDEEIYSQHILNGTPFRPIKKKPARNVECIAKDNDLYTSEEPVFDPISAKIKYGFLKVHLVKFLIKECFLV